MSSNASSYTWHEMTFCSRWDSQRCLVLCIGVDLTFQRLLQQTLSCMWHRLPPSDPFSLHVPLVQTILELHDVSVWSIRDVVRSIEKASLTCSYMSVVLTLHMQGRSPSTLGLQDFTMMHETARHAIHSFETLGVSVETVEAIEQQVTDPSTTHKVGSSNSAETSHQIRMYLDSQL
jgi:hypothetical protein